MSEWIIPLVTLTALEIVLGIDNLIFLAILADRLPVEQQPKARRVGLILALIMRLGLLAFINLLMSATQTLFTLPGGIFHSAGARDISFKDIVLIAGGVFLVGKATWEIHHKLEGTEKEALSAGGAAAASFGAVITQIVLIDIVFSLDSVITAVGMVKTGAPGHGAEAAAAVPGGVWVIVIAMVLTCIVMLFAAGPVGEFVNRHPTLKMLALSFLILIGVLLIAEGFNQHIDKGYIYFAMAFALAVELVNMRVRNKEKPPALNDPSPRVE